MTCGCSKCNSGYGKSMDSCCSSKYIEEKYNCCSCNQSCDNYYDLEGKNCNLRNDHYYNNYYTRYNNYYVTDYNHVKDYYQDVNVYHYCTEVVYDGCVYQGSTNVNAPSNCSCGCCCKGERLVEDRCRPLPRQMQNKCIPPVREVPSKCCSSMKSCCNLKTEPKSTCCSTACGSCKLGMGPIKESCSKCCGSCHNHTSCSCKH